MNIIRDNNIIQKFEGIWRPSKNPTDYDYDDDNQLMPYPKPYKQKWAKDDLVKKLKQIEKILIIKKSVIDYDKKQYHDCVFHDKQHIGTTLFKLNNIFWEDSLMHYIEKHNIKPSDEFINTILTLNVIKMELYNIPATMYVKYGIKYLKLHRNQLMIIDALFKHGSYTKKYNYLDNNNNNKEIYKYSEHSGLLDFDKHGIDKIIISGKTDRHDVNDDEIFLPQNIPNAYDYEYFFHTHPATPKPGGRAVNGILYEFPSVSDIFHFIEHYNNGLTQGSIVITPEGMYIIRKNIIDNKKIKLKNVKLMYNNMNSVMGKAQMKALTKYGINFNTNYFYTNIMNDITFINYINDHIHQYDLHIDFTPRRRDTRGNWILDTIYLPVYI